MLETTGNPRRVRESERRVHDAPDSSFESLSGKDTFYANGLRFSCARCSACCRYESGFVFLSEKDLALLCAALNMKLAEFIQTWCRWVPAENGTEELSLKEKSNCDCVFWSKGPAPEEGGCSVYESRPLQCRAFPFWSSTLRSENVWKITAEDCPGMNRGTLHSPEAIEKWLALRQKEPVLSRAAQVS